MHEASLHEQVEATLNRLTTMHGDLKERLDGAYGYAVFPSVGRASTVLGVAAGDGEVFERGRPVGFANLRQLTIGVQLGGQTFSELLLFDSEEALKHFKSSPVTFTANASAVIVKAGGSGTTDFDGVNAMAFKEGGELLELALGGQKFNFQPPGAGSGEETEEGRSKAGLMSRFSRAAARLLPRGRSPAGEQNRSEASDEKSHERSHEESNAEEAQAEPAQRQQREQREQGGESPTASPH